MLNQINQIMQTIPTAAEKKLQLRTGQLFTGRVTHWYPNQLAQMKLGTITLTARLEAQLEKGKDYWFRVVGMEGVPKLKVLEDIPLHNNKGFETIKPLLTKLGLSPSNTGGPYEQLVQRLIQDNIPFTKQNIVDGGALLHASFAKSIEDSYQILLQMLKHNLPLTKEVFLSLSGLHNDSTLAQSVYALQKGLAQSDDESHIQLKEILQQLVQIGLGKGSTHNLPFKGSLISDLFIQMGLQHERDIVEKAFQPNLKSLLLQYLQNSSPQHGWLQNHAAFILNRLTALQLLSNEEGPILHTIFQIPIMLGGEYRDWTIQWVGKRKKNGEIDEEHCRIIFFLDLEFLQETVIDVQIQTKIVSLIIYNEQQKPLELQAYWHMLLKRNLAVHDYTLSSIQWKNPEEKSTLKKVTTTHDYSTQGVDIRI
ncbi:MULTISPECIES: hypothetical protein [Bacillaceae]|uniref:Uncharacterized protein n=1 Tax=Evansella alkalicola TaxID=745819 RepID=A0ABS6JT15_9BACI|nr:MULTISPECIES: hypothetical protein [Bacillaceae]MBU9720300.1 hypothetical protein [Bacillus alkalicola]